MSLAWIMLIWKNNRWCSNPSQRFEPLRPKPINLLSKHGSWLNIAEIEFSVFNQRIADKPLLASEIAAWETRRNQNSRTVDWQFSTSDARIKLKRLYR